MYHPTCNSYFSGGGLLDTGFVMAGIKVQQSVDLDKKAIQCMQMNPKYHGHRIIWDDVTQMPVKEQPEADIYAFTYPCTKYSMIGEIHGVRTGDELYLHALRHLAVRPPEAFVVENVPGMKYFKVVMEAMTELPGYYYNVFCPVDAKLWLPQSRERLIIIATRKPFSISAPSPAKVRPSIKDILESDVNIRVNNSVIARIKGDYRDKPIVVDPEDSSSIAPTCVAHYAKDMGTRLVKDKSYKHGVRPFTVREYARLQGVPDDYNLPETNVGYKIVGNGVAVPKAHWVGTQLMKYFN